MVRQASHIHNACYSILQLVLLPFHYLMTVKHEQNRPNLHDKCIFGVRKLVPSECTSWDFAASAAAACLSKVCGVYNFYIMLVFSTLMFLRVKAGNIWKSKCLSNQSLANPSVAAKLDLGVKIESSKLFGVSFHFDASCVLYWGYCQEKAEAHGLIIYVKLCVLWECNAKLVVLA